MKCPICSDGRLHYLFVIRGIPIARCHGCGLVSIGVQSTSTIAQKPNPKSDPGDVGGEQSGSSATEREAAARYLAALVKRGAPSGRVLFIGPPDHPFVGLAVASGFEVQEYDLAGMDLPMDQAQFQAAVIVHQLQKSDSPAELLSQLHKALVPEGTILLTIPLVDAWPCRFFGANWPEWRAENRYYFDRVTIQSLLLGSGFRKVVVRSDKRLYDVRHIAARAAGAARTWLTRAILALNRVLPDRLRSMRIRLSTSGGIVTGTRSELPARPCCSIVLPAYNEGKTLGTLMDTLIEKRLDGIDRQIVLVESNSTDGTREIALRYQSHPEVDVILEERARGKGHAVRTGLRHARGDVILIQDADLEYDLNDYDELLAPVLSYRSLFVLGARHGGSWKMRRFAGQEGLSEVLNLGHLFFTALINFLYRQRMRDPFTMYKVFHRDCLYGLEFKCNRFDFDHELVIKLVRKGYTPLELPVNYWSRSFREGKKVRMYKDPLTWLWIDLKLRFTRLYAKEPD